MLCATAQELRAGYEACLPKLSEFWTEMGRNRALFDAYQALAKSPAAEQFTPAQKTILENELRDFHLSGIDLEPAKQKALRRNSNAPSQSYLAAFPITCWMRPSLEQTHHR